MAGRWPVISPPVFTDPRTAVYGLSVETRKHAFSKFDSPGILRVRVNKLLPIHIFVGKAVRRVNNVEEINGNQS